mmetsp:Transcript_10142/g.37128  ORF Transcript_10142/g.37128 Transcript_10142/m.37128 type:complete len:371 (+) Transcript_10142:289-1401(+)
MKLPECLVPRSTTVYSLVLGQVLSIMLTLTATFSSALAQRDVNLPTTQSAVNYLLLSVVFGTTLLARKQKVQVDWYKYAIWAFLDVEANFLVVKAFQYTSITSATLLDCWSIPCVMVLSWRFIGRRYSKFHIVGVLLCIAGLALLVVYDLGDSTDSDDDSGDSDSPRTALGDVLVLCGASLYAISNVTQEILVCSHSSVEVLAMLGTFASLVSIVQAGLLEHKEIARLELGDAKTMLYLSGYALCLFAFYGLVPLMLRSSSAAFFNLSLLTSDVWAVILRGTLFHHLVGPLYFVAAVVVTGGLILYNLAPEQKGSSNAQLARSADILPDESVDEQEPLQTDEGNEGDPSIEDEAEDPRPTTENHPLLQKR